MNQGKLQLAPRLETDRLVLRAPTLADAQDVYENHRHKSVADGVLSIPHPCPSDHGETWVRWVLDKSAAESLRVWVIEHRPTQRTIGDCGVHVDLKHRCGDIGYILRPDQQGHGYMTEALRAVMRWLFTDHAPPLERIYADVFPENEASLRLCQRLGMSREGVLRGSIRKNDQQRDAVRMAILRSEYLERQEQEFTTENTG